jgi:hypothetical protein
MLTDNAVANQLLNFVDTRIELALTWTEVVVDAKYMFLLRLSRNRHLL